MPAISHLPWGYRYSPEAGVRYPARRFAGDRPHDVMAVDSFTVLLFGLLIKLVLGGLFAAYWLNNRGSPWFAWWGAALACGSLTAALFMLRASPDAFPTIGLGNA